MHTNTPPQKASIDQWQVHTGRKTANVAVIGLGTDASENDLADDDSYKHISVFQPLSQILMPQLRQLQENLHTSKTDSRDAISSIVLAIMLIESFCKQLKYERRIVLVTNGTGHLDPDNTDEIATKLQKEGIHLTILGVDFDDPEYGSKEEDKPPAKAENERVFRELVAKAGGTLGTLQEAIDELATPRVKACPASHYVQRRSVSR